MGHHSIWSGTRLGWRTKTSPTSADRPQVWGSIPRYRSRVDRVSTEVEVLDDFTGDRVPQGRCLRRFVLDRQELMALRGIGRETAILPRRHFVIDGIDLRSSRHHQAVAGKVELRLTILADFATSRRVNQADHAVVGRQSEVAVQCVAYGCRFRGLVTVAVPWNRRLVCVEALRPDSTLSRFG